MSTSLNPMSFCPICPRTFKNTMEILAADTRKYLTYPMYIHTLANKPKVGIKLLLISYLLPESLCLLVSGSYSFFPHFLFNSESLWSLLTFNYLIFYHSSAYNQACTIRCSMGEQEYRGCQIIKLPLQFDIDNNVWLQGEISVLKRYFCWLPIKKYKLASQVSGMFLKILRTLLHLASAVNFFVNSM